MMIMYRSRKLNAEFAKIASKMYKMEISWEINDKATKCESCLTKESCRFQPIRLNSYFPSENKGGKFDRTKKRTMSMSHKNI